MHKILLQAHYLNCGLILSLLQIEVLRKYIAMLREFHKTLFGVVVFYMIVLSGIKYKFQDEVPMSADAVNQGKLPMHFDITLL